MRYLLLVLLFGCKEVKDNKLLDLQNKVKESQKQSVEMQNIAVQDNKGVIKKTVKTIVNLKQEVKELKTKLNEVTATK